MEQFRLNINWSFTSFSRKYPATIFQSAPSTCASINNIILVFIPFPGLPSTNCIYKFPKNIYAFFLTGNHKFCLIKHSIIEIIHLTLPTLYIFSLQQDLHSFFIILSIIKKSVNLLFTYKDILPTFCNLLQLFIYSFMQKTVIQHFPMYNSSLISYFIYKIYPRLLAQKTQKVRVRALKKVVVTQTLPVRVPSWPICLAMT